MRPWQRIAPTLVLVLVTAAPIRAQDYTLDDWLTVSAVDSYLWSPDGASSTTRATRGRAAPTPSSAWRRRAALPTLVGGTAATPAPAQDFGLGPRIPGVRLAVGVDPYDVTGSTAAQILLQLEGAGRPSWVRYPALFTWTFDAEVVRSAGGIPSDQCRFTEFEMVLDFTAVYPRWDRPADADPELVEAWAAFEAQIERQWARERDEYIARASEVVRRSRRHEDHCPLLVQRFHNLAVDVMDRSRPLEGRRTLEPLGLMWPPAGHEGLLVTAQPSSDDAPAAAVAGGRSGDADRPPGGERRPAVAVRAGRARPPTTPARDLEFAIQTDLRGTVPTGFVVGLHHLGTLEYLNAFGTHPETGETLTIDTPLPIPAFTEVLVSTLAVALDGTGFLDLDQPVSAYLENVSPGLGRVTTRQLLEHRAGLDNAPPFDSTMAWDQVLDRLNDRALVTEPGVLPSYSIYSFGLAARVIERTTRTTLEDALQRTLLGPLGMRSTYLGAREAEGQVGGLPVTHTSAADLLRFWYAWLDGRITGAGYDLIPDRSKPTLAPDGRSFRGGLWIDRPGAAPRLSMVCRAESTHVVVQVLPVTGTIVIAIGLAGWPLHAGTFVLDAVGRTLRIGNEIFGPVRLAGVAGFGRRERPCGEIWTSEAHVPVDFGPRAEAADWAGRYINGDWFFALQEEAGLLVSPRSEGGLWQIHHFEGETHFASVPPEEDEGVGFPFRLFRGPDGRRYVMLGDRAYLHEGDAPSR